MQTPVSSSAVAGQPEEPIVALRRVAFVVYVLQACGFLTGLTLIAGVVLNYIKRDETTGTWLESHFRWQIRTFWYGLLWSVVSLVLFLVVVGWFVMAVNAVWVIYRICKGWLRLNDGLPMYPPRPAPATA